MPDHLLLPAPVSLDSRRLRGGPQDQGPLEADRPGHATTLTGILAGLGFPPPTAEAEARSDEEPVDSRIVLVFDGRAALTAGPFRRWSMTPLAEGAGNAYLVLSDAESRALFAELVALYGGEPDEWLEPESWRRQLDAIAGVRLYDRQDRVTSELVELAFDQPEAVDVLIWPSTLEDRRRRETVARGRIDEIEGLVLQAGSRNSANRVVVTDPRPDTTMVRVIADRELLEAILDHPYVERVRPPLRPHVTHADLAGVPMPSTAPRPDGEAIGVIDDLIIDNPYLAGSVVDRAAFPPSWTYGPATTHGTNVAGIAAYGDLRRLVTGAGALAEPHPVLGARIMEEDPHWPGRAIVAGPLHTQIEAALSWLSAQGVKIAVCSINADGPDDAALPSETTATIDRLARELDMVIVLSAGNFVDPRPMHWLSDYADYLATNAAKVADPAGAALALSVGAVAYDDVPGGRASVQQVAIARTHQPSPFTRVGPTRGRTPAGALKPEFAANGGNFGWDRQLGLIQRDPSLGVITLAPAGTTGGRLVSVVDGTSFAAPFVANQVATLATRYPGAGANLLRALTALSGKDPSPATPTRLAQGVVVAAYGIPDAASVLESGPHRVVLTYEGTIRVGTSLVHELPIPAEFATGRLGQRFTVALAFDPPVRRSRRSYVAGAMDFDFVRNVGLDTVMSTYVRQPTRVQIAADPDLIARRLPGGRLRPTMEPGVTAVASNTLIRRRMSSGGWDPDDEGHYLVVTHTPSPWAKDAKDMPGEQSYAVAVELAVREDVSIDLRALVQARLRARARARSQR